MTPPSPAPIIDLIEAFRRSKAMFTAASMGLFDRLQARPDSSGALAQEIGVHAGALERLLDACAALGLLDKRDGVFRLTPLAECYLSTSSPYSLDGYIRYSDEVLYPMWSHLADAVKEGTPRWQQHYGIEGSIFGGFFRTDEAMRRFLQGMHGLGMGVSPLVASAFDLGGFRRLVDLGGATGHLTIAACERWPQLSGVVFDLPRVTPVAREMIAASPAHGRIEVVDGDFFTGELPPADLYSLGRILHDWSDEQCALLLRKIYDRLPADGALLVVEKLLAEDGVGPLSANLQSLNMLVVTEGRERSLGDYTRLLESAGFVGVQGHTTGAWLDAVLAHKR
jgi:acetylserotonin N-methyltransferase